MPRRRSCSPEEGPTIRAWTLKTSATARITMCLICPHPRLLIAQPATEPSSLGVSRVPSGCVTLKRRCTYRPSVIYLIVNKLLSLSLSLSPTGSVTIKIFIGAPPSMPGHREVINETLSLAFLSSQAFILDLISGTRNFGIPLRSSWCPKARKTVSV